jgi:hypothetical protein
MSTRPGVELDRNWNLPACRLTASDLTRVVKIFVDLGIADHETSLAVIESSKSLSPGVVEFQKEQALEKSLPEFRVQTRFGDYSSRDWNELTGQITPTEVTQLTFGVRASQARFSLKLDLQESPSVANAIGQPQAVKRFIADVRDVVEPRKSAWRSVASRVGFAIGTWAFVLALTGALAVLLVSRLHLPSHLVSDLRASAFIGGIVVPLSLLPILVIANGGGLVTNIQVEGWGTEPRKIYFQRRFLIGLLSLAGALAIGVLANVIYDTFK